MLRLPFLSFPRPSATTAATGSSPLRRRAIWKKGGLSTQEIPNLRRLTSRIVELTRRRQLRQILEEVEVAKRRYGKLNTIVMNAVMEACVHCKDVDAALGIFKEMACPESCGVDNITYGTLLKGLGDARRIDEAFGILESVELGTAVGNPKLSAVLIGGLLNALIEAGDLRRANGLLARYGYVLHEGGSPSVLLYNMLMKGYILSGSPLSAFTVYNDMLRQGLDADRLTYNTLIFACVKAGNLVTAMRFFELMKEHKYEEVQPDAVTYTILLQGFGNSGDLDSVLRIIIAMKSQCNLAIDRTAYTATIDALLNCGSIKGALCVYGELVKHAGENPELKPKCHLFLSMMRALSDRGDYLRVKLLHRRMWTDSAGTITPRMQEEADHLLVEAALNDGQIELALHSLSDVVRRWKGIRWTDRGGLVALRLEAMLGMDLSLFSPFFLSQVSLTKPIESIMIPFEAARPLKASLRLSEAAMRFFKESVVPIIDDWGSCIGLLHREDCSELNAELGTMMRSPPPCVTAATSIHRVFDLILEKKYKMVVIVKNDDTYGERYSNASISAIGVFTSEKLFGYVNPAIGTPG
ncbi:hypothetical protein MLD38_015197 [Melastoma candidum]|uniref:Uncharacterized protein n=1 Tax=Melastoma candidum TaxID=119954 RepID=A0ACB9RJI4_9MYRT|nr:hypothetical protein MLD38_015197 [Melastoma candidum]